MGPHTHSSHRTALIEMKSYNFIGHTSYRSVAVAFTPLIVFIPFQFASYRKCIYCVHVGGIRPMPFPFPPIRAGVKDVAQAKRRVQNS